MPVCSLLSIFIITFNRASDLCRTLDALNLSLLSNCKITVLDNCSVDETSVVVKKKADENVNIIHRLNKVNIGSAANAVQAFILSETQYTWVICDDDEYDLSKLYDVINVMLEKAPELILVGGHHEKIRKGQGQIGTCKELMKKGHDVEFYRDVSFLPGAIYKTEFALKCISDCYKFCFFNYPQIAFAFKVANSDCLVYVSQNRWVTATIGGQSYTSKEQFLWWQGLSNEISDLSERRVFMAANHRGPLDQSGLYGLMNAAFRNRCFSVLISIVYLYKTRVIYSIFTMISKRFFYKNK